MTGAASPRRPPSSPAVWRAAEVADAGAWTVVLDDAQREEIVRAVRSADGDDLELPTLADEVARWSVELAEGRGFVLVRGFPVDRLAPDEIERGYVGLGRHLGVPVGQNAQGDTLTHVRDERLPAASGPVRRYRTRLRQDFHTDGADVVGLLCLHPALSGGESRLASAGAVYTELLERRPDLLEVLYQPFHWDRQGDHEPGEQPWFEGAPLNDLPDGPRFFYIGWYIRDAQRHPEVPRLTVAQLEAMELLESIANDPAVHVEMDFRPGDIQWLNNARILHAREAYTDAEDPAERRHLLRLWLATHRFASVEDRLRAGLGGTGS
ncbi:MAG TPA: TauD/TfdA family dioxygenase [Acidimicrobiales bacterium]|nr:TauD/TfdA family dioxygenase [Acidimicrobiales bacterium]